MIFVLVGVGTLLARVRGGVLHAPAPAPAPPASTLELPRSSYAVPIYSEQHINSYEPSYQQDKSVSYSVSQADYDYLKQYKNGGETGQYSTSNLHSTHEDTTHHYASNDYNGHSLALTNTEQNYESDHRDNLVSVHQISELVNSAAQSHSYRPSFGLSAAPLVTKHIYFHVPPPEVDDVPVRAAPIEPPKKTYKILFIKLPSQELRSPVVFQAGQQAAVDEKTLIYVLVKKPDQPVVAPPPPPPAKVSEHQVLFVKYRGEPYAATTAGAAAGALPVTQTDLYH